MQLHLCLILLLTPPLSAVCGASQAQLKFLAFLFLHCPCLRHKLLAPTWKAERSDCQRQARGGERGGGRKNPNQAHSPFGGAKPPLSAPHARGSGAQRRAAAGRVPKPWAPTGDGSAAGSPLAGSLPAAARQPYEREHCKHDYRPESLLESESVAF